MRRAQRAILIVGGSRLRTLLRAEPAAEVCAGAEPNLITHLSQTSPGLLEKSPF